MPKSIRTITIILVVLAILPIALVSRKRAVPERKPRLHMVMDMDNQHKFRAQHANELFADGRAMRPVIEGTVARGESVLGSSQRGYDAPCRRPGGAGNVASVERTCPRQHAPLPFRRAPQSRGQNTRRGAPRPWQSTGRQLISPMRPRPAAVRPPCSANRPGA